MLAAKPASINATTIGTCCASPRPALPVEADKRAAPADFLLYLHLTIHQVPQVPDHNAPRFYPGLLQKCRAAPAPTSPESRYV